MDAAWAVRSTTSKTKELDTASAAVVSAVAKAGPEGGAAVGRIGCHAGASCRAMLLEACNDQYDCCIVELPEAALCIIQ